MARDLTIVDCDTHIHEPRTMWRDYADPEFRDSALALEDDELGYAWLTWRGERLYLAEVQFPGQAKRIGEERRQLEAGRPAEHPYDEVLPPEYTDPKARVAKLDEWGLDAAVCFPNFGLLWEDMLAGDLPALCANMRAFNRWMTEVVAEGDGRLFGVAHLTLRDRDWVTQELKSLSAAGIKLAMVGPAPVDGKPLSHADLDPVWAAFVENDIAPVFHVGNFRSPLDPAWHQGDPERVDRLLDSVHLWVAPAVALGNMIVHGVFDRHPDLRLGIIELSSHWVPQWMLMLEGAYGFYASRHAATPRPLRKRPSDYVRDHVRVGVLAYEQPKLLIEQVGPDTFMFGSDWPHAEGIPEPLRSYEPAVEDLQGEARAKLFAGNLRWLMNV